MMLTDSRSIMARLVRDGWTHSRSKGSHRMFRRSGEPLTIVVPYPTKDLPICTVRDIYGKAGWAPD